MARTLKTLIQASGNSGAVGQSFRNHVTGAATGAKMTDYILSAWGFSGGVPAPELTYTTSQAFAMNIDHTQGSRAFNIKRTGAVVTESDISVPLGATIALSSNNTVAASTGSTITVTVGAPYNPAATAVCNSGWFDGYTYPSAPGDQAAHPVTMYHTLSGAGGSGTQHVTWYLIYQPDIPGFNPQLMTSFDANFNNRAETTADWEFQFYSDSGYTTLVGSSVSYTFDSLPEQISTYWTKARRIGSGGSYGALGPTSFTDPRLLI